MKPRSLQILLAAVLATGSLAAQEPSSVRLGPPNLLGTMNNFSAGLPFTRWRSGHLLAWDKQKEPTGKIGIYRSDMQLERTVSFSIEHAISLSVVSVDMTKGGELVASGVAIQQDGAKARYLALISPEGLPARIIRTEPYLPQFVCAADGVVWTVGEEWLGPGRVKQSGYSVLREYSFDKGLLRDMVAREQLRGARVSFGGPVHSAILQCDGGLVRFYSQVTQQWFQYDIATGKLDQDDLEPFSNSYTEVTGFAVTPKGRVLASIQNLQSIRETRVFELSNKAANGRRHWAPVAGTGCDGDEGCIVEVLGIEGHELTFVRADSGAFRACRSALAEQ